MRLILSVLLFLSPVASIAETTATLNSPNRLETVKATYTVDPTRHLAIADSPNDTTDGDGAIHFGGHTNTKDGSKYFGIMVSLDSLVDLREKALLLDARSATPECRAFYVRLYNEGERQPAWSFNSWNGALGTEWRTFTLQAGFSLSGLAWEQGKVADRIATRVNRVEFIIGSRTKDVAISALVDNLRVAPRKKGIQDLKAPKVLVRDTPVVVDGEPRAVILHPDSVAGQSAAKAIVDIVRQRTGVTLTARVAAEADRQPEQTAFLLGNVETNPAMLLHYARFLTPVDALCPGTEGALVHTVFDPFGKGVNSVVLGASDDAGLAKAVDLLGAIIEAQPAGTNLVLPRIFKRAYGEDFLKRTAWADDDPDPERLQRGLAQGQKALDTGKHTSVAGVLSNVARRYQLTGHSVEAKLFVRLWDLYQASAVENPRGFGGPWGFDSDFRSKGVVSGWRSIEYDPSLTDAERLATVKAMGRWLREAVVPSCAGAVGSDRVPHNHQTFPALGTLFAGLYFTEGFDVAEGPLWLGMADAIFQRQATYFKPHEDCNGYQWLTNGHLMRYTVARPDFTFYKNGNAKRVIDFCIGNMDNLGYQVPYGDTGSWQCWDAETLCLDIFRFVTGDEHAAWAGNYKHELKNTRALFGFQAASSDAAPPTDYDGVRVWPLEPQYYHGHGAEERPTLEESFDKISFREKMNPDAAYLLLDGLSNGGHKHYDGNSVPRLTLYDRIWLADNDYYKSAVKFHNSMMAFKDGESGPIPPYVEHIDSGESERYGFSRTRVQNYAGVDWERQIVWLKEAQAFVFLDTLTAHETDDYQFRALWHGIGAPTLHDEGLLLEQDGPSLWIQVAAGPELRLHNDHELGANWKGYKHADPVVRSLSAMATVHLEAGESYRFASVLHGAAEGIASPWKVGFRADGEALIVKRDASALSIPFPDSGAQTPPVAEAAASTPLQPSVNNLEVDTSAPPHEEIWRLSLTTSDGKRCQVTRQATARLDGPKQPATVLAATMEGLLFAVTPEGTLRWKQDLATQLNDVVADDLDGDGIDEIVVGRQDHQVTVLDAAGDELWSREIDYYRKPPYVNVVRTGDLDGDGTPEVIIGGENWRFYAFTAEGEELWNYESVHPSRSGALADLDGDGKAEVLCGTHYYYFTALKPDGTPRWKGRFGPICHDVATGSFDGDGTRGVVAGGGDGYVHYFGSDGTVRMQYNTGDEVTLVRAGDLDGDGIDEIVAASKSHNVYCFNADGERRWRRDLGAPLTALALDAGEGAFVIAGASNGTLVTLDQDGAVRNRTTLAGAPREVVMLGNGVAIAATDATLIALTP